jgi:hypothetical protein
MPKTASPPKKKTPKRVKSPAAYYTAEILGLNLIELRNLLLIDFG